MSAFFRRTKSLVGLDIGSSAVKAVELRQTASGYKVAAIGSEPVPPHCIVDGAIVDGGAVVYHAPAAALRDDPEIQARYCAV